MTASRAERPAPFRIAGEDVAPGATRRLDLPVARLPTHTPIHLPLTVVHGLRRGPCLWLSAALHGDELNGIEIIRRVLLHLRGRRIAGTLLAAPILNVFGFLQQSRYLPDRRDLNRSFPGSSGGSLAARVAHLFMQEVVARATHGVDLHTASNERENLPQVRGNLDDPETARCAEAFGAPVVLHAALRSGSLRAAASRTGSTVLVYEAGEAQRFNRDAISIGVRGVLRLMRELGMLPRRDGASGTTRSVVVRRSSWIRARRAGLARMEARLGERVVKGRCLAYVSDPFGDDPIEVRAPFPGIVLGRTNNPVVNRGDALLNLGRLD